MAIASKFLPRVKKKVIAVEKLLEGSVAAEKKKIDDAKREASEERKAKSEEQLEKKEEKGDKLPFKQQRQKVGDFLSNFITNMLLGAAVMKLLDFVNSEHFQSFIDGVKATVAFIENVGGMLLGGLISFIDWAYGLYDGLRGFVYDNFGEEGLKKFDTFMENFNTFLNTALIAIMAFLKFKFLRVGLGKLGGFITKIFRRGILRAAKRLGLKFFGKAATKFLGKGLSAAKGFIGKGLSAVGKGVGGLAAKIFGKSAGVIAPALKGAMGAVKNFFGRIPIVGPIVVAIVSLLSGEPPAQAVFKALGAALGGALGTFIPIPVLGTLLGETIGAFVGDLLYYGIMEGNWKKAGKVFGQTLKAILSAGGKVLEYIGGVGKRFFGDFPTVDVPDFRLGELIGDMLTKVPVIGDIVNFELKLPGPAHFALNLIPGIPEEFKTALKEGFSIREVLNSLPGLREVLGAFAQFIPGLSKFVENGALMKIPNLLLLTPPGLPFLVPHIGKSLFPGLFDGKPREARTDVPPPPDSGGGFMDFLSGGTSTTTATAPTGGGQPMLRGSDEGGTGIPDEGSGTTASGTTSKRMITGPAGYDRIGAGAAYHVDTKFHSSLGMSGMISAMDQMANAYAARGKEIVFSGQGYARLKAYKSNLDSREKKKLLSSAIDAHSHSTFMRAQGFKPFDYYIPDISANKDLYHPSTEKAEILLPNFGGNTKVGALYGGYGKSADIFDSTGKHVAMTGHGDLAYARGGFTKAMAHRALLGEKGREFVIDADSTAALEAQVPGFLYDLNKAKGREAVNVLRAYASYESGADETVVIPMPAMAGGSSGSGSKSIVKVPVGRTENSSFDTLYQGA